MRAVATPQLQLLKNVMFTLATESPPRAPPLNKELSHAEHDREGLKRQGVKDSTTEH